MILTIDNSRGWEIGTTTTRRGWVILSGLRVM